MRFEYTHMTYVLVHHFKSFSQLKTTQDEKRNELSKEMS